MNKNKFTSLFLALFMSAGAYAQVEVNVDTENMLCEISPMLYGIFFEDINHAADGGLYAELISNRSFEDDDSSTPTWQCVADNGATISTEIITKDLLNKYQHQAIRAKVKASPLANAALVNEGFWGINAVHGQKYKLSFWARGKYNGKVKAVLCNEKGERIYGEGQQLFTMTKKWNKCETTLIANANDPKARFALVLDGEGTVDFDVVSLFPPTFKNRENGCRIDLAMMLQDLKPKFMRFPGGCFVEGQESPDNAFHWEKTIGPIEEREGHLNRNWYYRTSDGLGFHEYLQLAEDLGAKPLYVVNVGIWHGGLTPVDELKPWIDECMNALEYANGDVHTKYGAMRAANGHPEPFNIEYLEIGNENNQPDPAQQSDRYYERYKLFKDAVLAKYPQMHLIGNVVAWGDDNPKWSCSESVELLDEHYYRSPSWFVDNYHKYDKYPRGGARIYCGEYAVTQGFGKMGSLTAALGEAVFMMGMENNSDIVDMASYAPIFVNENNATWVPDMIRFNSEKAMGTPSYYVQKLLAHHVGTKNAKTTVVADDFISAALPQLTPTRSQFGYATWGTNASYQFVEARDLTHSSTVTSDLGKAQKLRGNWNVDGKTISQKSNGQGCLFVDGAVIDSDEYEIMTKARKDSGAEGFIVVFNYVDPENYCWLNLGGWGNTQHGLEQTINGNKVPTANNRGHIEEGKWYDIYIRVKGDSILCKLNDEIIFNTKLKQSITPGIFANAQLDEQSGDVIVKVVNTSSQATVVNVNLKNTQPSACHLIRMSSQSGDDENTLSQPINIYPIEQDIFVGEKGISNVIPGYSLNIYRIKK